MKPGRLPVRKCMQMKRYCFWTKPVLLALMTMALASCDTAHPAPQIDWQPPGFEISSHGEAVFHYPESLEGPTIILFWATWCPYCKALMPHLQSIVDEYDGRVQVVALNFRDDDDPAAYLAERGYGFRLILHSEEVAKSWGVKGTPGLFLADQSGRVVFSRGAIPKAAYRADPSENYDQLKHYQKAARRAPYWAAKLRIAIDQLLQ
jgi:cytochrome c biogenesis protein CcmG/thiol:disulfide interchange protein DsbE